LDGDVDGFLDDLRVNWPLEVETFAHTAGSSEDMINSR
jgi:hypothetical protein